MVVPEAGAERTCSAVLVPLEELQAGGDPPPVEGLGGQDIEALHSPYGLVRRLLYTMRHGLEGGITDLTEEGKPRVLLLGRLGDGGGQNLSRATLPEYPVEGFCFLRVCAEAFDCGFGNDFVVAHAGVPLGDLLSTG